MGSRVLTFVLLLLACWGRELLSEETPAGRPANPVTDGPGFTIELQTARSGYDRKTCWVHARAGIIPHEIGGGDPFRVVMTMHALRFPRATSTKGSDAMGFSRLALIDPAGSARTAGSEGARTPWNPVVSSTSTTRFSVPYLSSTCIVCPSLSLILALLTSPSIPGRSSARNQ